MSGIKPNELNLFFASLHARGLDTAVLAEICGCSRPSLTRVLNGSRKRGPIWRRVSRHLLASEIALLDVAHCSPWNTHRVAKRPVWNSEKAAALST
ncbi:MAG: hypothetical protein WC205_04140 [Opitutaceae bacterium]|jgi:hypothetical protein